MAAGSWLPGRGRAPRAGDDGRGRAPRAGDDGPNRTASAGTEAGRLLVALGAGLALLGGCAGAPATPVSPSVAVAAGRPSAGTSAPVAAAPPASATAAPGVSLVTTPAPSSTTGVVTVTGVPFTPPIPCTWSPNAPAATCRLGLDIAAPASGGPWPLVVMLRGGPSAPNGRDYLAPLAEALAVRGAVVFVPDVRQSADYAGGFPATFQDIACAIGVARRLAPAYGADPGRVTLMGHSLGGWTGAVVALTGAAIHAAAGDLRRDGRPAHAGGVRRCRRQRRHRTAGSRPGRRRHGRVPGGDRMAKPEAWAAVDPFALLLRHPAGPEAIPFLVVQGGADSVVKPSVSQDFATALQAAGYAVRLLVLPEADHVGVLDAPDTSAALLALTAGP